MQGCFITEWLHPMSPRPHPHVLVLSQGTHLAEVEAPRAVCQFPRGTRVMAVGHVLRCAGTQGRAVFWGTGAQAVPQIPVTAGQECMSSGFLALGFPSRDCRSIGGSRLHSAPFLQASGLSVAGGWAALSASSGAAAHAMAGPEGWEVPLPSQ